MTAIVCGVIIAAPSPWNTLARMSIVTLVDNPHQAEDEREDDQPDLIDGLGADLVAESAGEQQRHRVGQQVGAGHPDDLVDVGIQSGQDRRRRHRHDGRVDQDHEEADAQRP